MKITADWLQDPISQKLLNSFEAEGVQALFVGGCVRNAILNQPVVDLDIATAAIPEVSSKIASAAGFKVIPTGIDHGTITVVAGKKSFEITSFRKDVETFGRRAVVSFSGSIVDDALRRDFTMNALYLTSDGTVVDPLNGLADVKSAHVRFIENPENRIKEDYLRILRYFRFHAWYGNPTNGTDADAMSAIAKNTDGLKQISKERIGSEIRKLLSARDPTLSVCAMEQSGVLNTILPGSSAKCLGPLVHFEQDLSLPPDWLRRLLSLGGANQTKALRLSKVESNRIHRYQKAMESGASAGEIAYRFGVASALDVALNTSAALASHPQPQILDEINTAAAQTFPVSAADLPRELVGPQIGKRLKQLENRWIASDFKAQKFELLKP